MKLFKKITSSKSDKKKSISSHIFSKSWKKVLQAVSSDKTLARSCDARCCVNCEASHAPLQFVCCCKPPLSIVEAMITAYPDAVEEVDCMGRLPLHVACEYAALPEVIKYLIERYPAALKISDKNGKLPLHSLLENFWGRSDPNLSEEDGNKQLLTTIHELLKHSPTAVLAEDIDGMCPIEYALAADHEHVVVHTLQKSSEGVRRRIFCHAESDNLQKSTERMSRRICEDGDPVTIPLA